jgi:hypothetical protein
VEFDVVNLRVLRTANAGSVECLANLPGEMDELVKVRSCNCVGVMFDQKKPVATPGHVADHHTKSRHFDVDGSGPTVAGYVFEGYCAICVQDDSHNAYWRFHAMRTGLDPAQMRERGYNTNGSMPAHTQASTVIEENHARDAVRTGGFAEQCAHHCFGSPRFGDESPAEGFVIPLKQKAALLQVAAAEVRATFDDGSGGLTAGVRIDDPYFFQKTPLFRFQSRL